MRNVDWIKLKLNQKMINLKTAQVDKNLNLSSSSEKLIQNTQKNIINNIQRQFINPEQIRMNSLANMDRAVYVKNLLNLPKNMADLLVLIQDEETKPNKQITKQKTNNVQNNLQPDNKNSINKNIEKPYSNVKNIVKNNIDNKNIVKQNFNGETVKSNQNVENKNQQIQNKIQQNLQKNEQLNNITQNNIFLNGRQVINENLIKYHNKSGNIKSQFQNRIPQNAEQFEKSNDIPTTEDLELIAKDLAPGKQIVSQKLNQQVNITHVATFLQKNSKVAMNKMISMMAMATAQGMTDTKPLQDTMNIISSSISSNLNTNSTQTLKNLILLYLPWLPLQEGVSFNLEIEQDEEIPTSESFIKVMITTVNFGNLNATISLITNNSVDISITCLDTFPKKELFKKLFNASTEYSMKTVIDFKKQKYQLEQDTINPKAKINLSNVTTINPYLLLMAHSVIRYTIELDMIQSSGGEIIPS